MKPSHWTVPPETDHRTWLPMASRGVVARGHARREPCPGCQDLPVTEAPKAPASAAIQSAGARVRRLVAARKPAEIDVASITVREVILVAASDVARGTEGGVVEVTALVIRAWQIAPARFCLGGRHAEHPDSNRVISKLSGDGGLVGIGWLRRVSSGEYAVTPMGERRIAELRRRAAA